MNTRQHNGRRVNVLAFMVLICGVGIPALAIDKRADFQATDTAAIVAADGRQVSVRGVVDRVSWAPSGKLAYVGFRGTEQGGFSGKIFKDDYDGVAAAFGGDLEAALKNRDVIITGRVDVFQNRPTMAINRAAQIKVLGMAAPAPDATDD